MVNRDMNGFPVKKCSAFQFFKKRHNILQNEVLVVRRWIKSPMVSMEKHQTSSLKYPGATVMHIPQGEPDIEVPFCQMCFSDHTFPKGIIPQDSESCSWEGPRSCNIKELYGKEDLLTQSDQRTFWNSDDSDLLGVFLDIQLFNKSMSNLNYYKRPPNTLHIFFGYPNIQAILYSSPHRELIPQVLYGEGGDLRPEVTRLSLASCVADFILHLKSTLPN
ncbi:hypothetical protein E2320_019245 [Naja naja]|nr:hypothetical protein E2320_019245 [Naja naja]